MEILDELAVHARDADEKSVWPTSSWQLLNQLGGLRWKVPKKYGGDELSGAELLARYESLAGACMTTCFILTQRDSACGRLHAAGKEHLSDRLFPALVRGDAMITVGLAQLTTSRQHGKPAVLARMEGDHVIIGGVIPWVTGSPRAEHILTGAALENGDQVVVVLPTDVPGVTVGTPIELAALQGSLTAEVRCDQVRLPLDWLLAGPAKLVVIGERGGPGGLETSCLALGLARSAIGYLFAEMQQRPQLEPHARRLENARASLHIELMQLAADKTGMVTAVQAVRARANALVLHATQAALAASKGTGFVRSHPVQRWARQALFFLVWSSPWPVTDATMSQLSSPTEQQAQVQPASAKHD